MSLFLQARDVVVYSWQSQSMSQINKYLVTEANGKEEVEITSGIMSIISAFIPTT